MPKPRSFARPLVRLRREHGFATPYAFYKKRDGRRLLKLTFVNYLSLERGASLPKPWRLERIFAALDIPSGSSEARELFYAYLADLLGSEELLSRHLPALSADSAPEEWRRMLETSRRALGQRRSQLDISQLEVLASVPAAYACHILLGCTAEGFETEELARRTRFPEPQVRRALKALAGVRMIKTVGRRAVSQVSGRFVPPTPTPPLAGIYAALQKERERWIAARGRPVHSSCIHVRVSPERLAQYSNQLRDAVNMAATYADNRDKKGSDIYVVEGRVTRIFAA